MWAVCLAFASLAAAARTSEDGAENMNGKYTIANAGSPWPTDFRDYPGGVESFDYYHGPITSTYGQVWWGAHAGGDLPKEIVERFAGKVMAIVGVEMDQVRRKGDKDVDGSVLHQDVSVPINVAYNHHHSSVIVGTGSELKTMSPDEAKRRGLRGIKLSGGEVLAAVEHTPSVSGSCAPWSCPTSALFDDGNGGEYRKTYHGYAPPFAQLVESPSRAGGGAMQIDTWNRDSMNLSGSPFVPGPQPRGALAPRSGPDAVYSGLLECPLTTRVEVLPDAGSESFGAGKAPFGQGTGRFRYKPNCSTEQSFEPACHQWGYFKANRCAEAPRGDLITQRNPTCDIRTVRGGLHTCLHGWHLLDEDQALPWPDQPLRYYKKYRVYFTEYRPGYHKNIFRQDMGIGASDGSDVPQTVSPNGGAEYDVPQCAENRGGRITNTSCTHLLTGTWMPVTQNGSIQKAYEPGYFGCRPALQPAERANENENSAVFAAVPPPPPRPSGCAKVYLAAMHGHCHAPTCLRLDVFDNRTNELICSVKPVYGGRGGYVADRGRTFDEPGYIANPPCMFEVNSTHGLPPPLLMNGLTIRVEHVTNSTYGHHGEMALPQAMLAYNIYG